MTNKQRQVNNQVVSNSAIPLPDPPDPQKWICVQLMIPDNIGHKAAFLGAISNLATWRVWMRDTDHSGKIVAELWKKARRSVKFVKCEASPNLGVAVGINPMDDLIQVIEDSNGHCLLQYRCCEGADWITVASLSDLNTNPSGAGNQPAPGGGISQDCVTIYANQTYAIPVPVNTGDLIEITSASGKWSDQVARWLCIDGNLFFIDCTGVGGASGAGGDFLPSANHMSAIVRFSTGYFPLYPGASLIVPAGIVNEQPEILANKPAVNSGDGWIDICWKVTNNQAATWTRTLDFRLSPNGFVFIPFGGGNQGQWTPGSGYQTTVNNVSGAPDTSLIIHRTFPATMFTSANITCNTNQLPSGAGAGNSVLLRHSGVTTATVCLASLFNGTQTDSWSGSATVDEIVINPSSGNNTLLTEISMVLTGTGTPPF